MSTIPNFDNVLAQLYRPSPRYQPQFGFFKSVRKQVCDGGVHAFRLLAFGFGAHGIKIDKPGFEQCLSNGFEGCIGFAQQGESIVERPQ
ncbi:hypothetical protein D3C84_708680 [compost metagenome]